MKAVTDKVGVDWTTKKGKSCLELVTRGRMHVGFWATVRGDVAVLGSARGSFGFYVASALGLTRFSAVFLHRVAAHFHGRRGPFAKLGKIAHRWNAIINGCEIDAGAVIGPGLHLPHPHGIVFGPIRAGRNLTSQQNVTIGLRHPELSYNDPENFPVIDDDVYIGAGAVVVGPIKVGRGARIGCNAVVLHDMAVSGTAVGPAATIRELPADARAQEMH